VLNIGLGEMLIFEFSRHNIEAFRNGLRELVAESDIDLRLINIPVDRLSHDRVIMMVIPLPSEESADDDIRLHKLLNHVVELAASRPFEAKRKELIGEEVIAPLHTA